MLNIFFLSKVILFSLTGFLHAAVKTNPQFFSDKMPIKGTISTTKSNIIENESGNGSKTKQNDDIR